MKYAGAVNDRPVLQSDGSAGGLYYLSARHYDPNSGRFLQQDTYKGDAMSPWTQNLYAYTSNNPVNYVDPTGQTTLCKTIPIPQGRKRSIGRGKSIVAKQTMGRKHLL
ncbi:RHS repeat-associated core domain-containing protein [Eubacteriales bacterium OttesenSCG-928-M02]|nr:RHS repeat-associated core domain-containing protein [Eubacteriales bacterium OttesenSCG-928-M02]